MCSRCVEFLENMENIYCIAEVYLCLKENGSLSKAVWRKFWVPEGVVNARIEIASLDEGVFYGVEKYTTENVSVVFRDGGDVMLVSADWRSATILPLEDYSHLQAFLIQLFWAHAIKKRMIQTHSALIDFEGRGLLFLGPSGIGKTTQAELWAKYRNALIINGDIVFVQETQECFLGWGTPWHGSSPYCENASVPVHAMVVLKQAEENSIRELTGFEKVSEVSNSIFYPQWLENGMELCLETLDHLLREIPVYELSCRPDEAAVELTEQTIFYRK